LNKQLILGTAGHIDHGKSSLVRALTGVDPDRLPEEKKRGITIELGFAKMQLGDMTFGIVDVPGHERFVRTMVSGATGIDLVILVIAADAGVMPQTREHLDICELLGIRSGMTVITKTDLIDDEDWLELVKEDVASTLEGTFLEESPIISVSSHTGQGLDELKKTIQKMAPTVKTKERRSLARLPIDRVFEQKGFGPVITGTLHSGTLQEGDQIALLPDGLSGRVRGLQAHGESIEKAVAGQRTAVNIQGIDLTDIHRGQVLIHSEQMEPTLEIDGFARLLSHLPSPIKQRASLLIHTGTVQIPCKIWLYDGDLLEPGESSYVRIRLDKPTVLLPGDRFRDLKVMEPLLEADRLSIPNHFKPDCATLIYEKGWKSFQETIIRQRFLFWSMNQKWLELHSKIFENEQDFPKRSWSK